MIPSLTLRTYAKVGQMVAQAPHWRKEILAELLKLNQYDDLEERAKVVALFQRSGGAARAEFAVMETNCINVVIALRPT